MKELIVILEYQEHTEFQKILIFLAFKNLKYMVLMVQQGKDLNTIGSMLEFH